MAVKGECYHGAMKIQETFVAVVAIVAAFAIPALGILQPILRDLIPLILIAGSVGIFTLAARHLLRFAHDLRMQELERRERLLAQERANYREVERTLERHGSPEAVASRAGLTEDELLREAERIERERARRASGDERSAD